MRCRFCGTEFESDDVRKISSMLFEIARTPGYHSAVIVIPVEVKATRCCRPVDRDQDWLDVKRGHQLYVNGKRRTVYRVRLYRTNRPLVGEIEVESGRDWLRTRRERPARAVPSSIPVYFTGAINREPPRPLTGTAGPVP